MKISNILRALTPVLPFLIRSDATVPAPGGALCPADAIVPNPLVVDSFCPLPVGALILAHPTTPNSHDARSVLGDDALLRDISPVRYSQDFSLFKHLHIHRYAAPDPYFVATPSIYEFVIKNGEVSGHHGWINVIERFAKNQNLDAGPWHLELRVGTPPNGAGTAFGRSGWQLADDVKPPSPHAKRLWTYQILRKNPALQSPGAPEALSWQHVYTHPTWLLAHEEATRLPAPDQVPVIFQFTLTPAHMEPGALRKLPSA